MFTDKQIKSFWNRVNIKSENECWEWTGLKSKNGYGKTGIRNRISTAHRTSYFLHNEIFDTGLYVLHHCDNRLCVNPKHLYQGTPKDNVADMLNRKRDNYSNGYIHSEETKNKMSNSQRGIKNHNYGNFVLDEITINKIKELKAKNYSIRSICSILNTKYNSTRKTFNK